MDLALYPQDPVLLDATPGGAKMTLAPIQGKCPVCHQDSANTAFQAGAASRDAEVAQWQKIIDEEAKDSALVIIERDQLSAQINRLLDAVKVIETDSEEVLDFDECTAMCVPMDSYHDLVDAAEATPAQSLAEYRNKVIEAFVNEFSRHVGGDGEFWLHELQDFAMKEQP